MSDQVKEKIDFIIQKFLPGLVTKLGLHNLTRYSITYSAKVAVGR